ncbi:BatA domain-containing protein [Microbulbifer pacificus]|uniref:BatA domain-containing protein n=1 Tax=Microbulbifer pacificus TaxID=407164 RepID=UPI000CF53999|nr:BatA domain-containing protein [Microbulbifer pacificus]
MSFAEALILQSPIWLWLLGALAIPLLIHLMRRSAPREITFAAVQWLQQKRQRQWQRLFLRDRRLLLLRMLLLALLALLLTSPLYQRPAQPSAQILLVDPAVSDTALQDFLAAHPAIADVYWLQSAPTDISTPRPAAVDVGQTLTQLAYAGEFRRAHILLQQMPFPASYQTLKISPLWQWHHIDAGETGIAPPRMAVIGSAPPWLKPALRQLALPEPQYLSRQSEIDPRKIDWLIYDTPGELPPPVLAFIRGGGMLITDARGRDSRDLDFAEIEPGLEVASVGRGNWLRYRDDWHRETFYHHRALPQRLWQQWSAQDWQRQYRARGHWFADAGIAVTDEEVSGQFRQPMQPSLLLLFALLLLAERTIALSRRNAPAVTASQVDGKADV